jgi:hypothetical protein
MSYKSDLNEYCQKNKFTAPKYESKSIGENHNPQWYCKITILDREFYSTNPSKTKIEAEQLVSKTVLQHLHTTEILTPNIISPTVPNITSPIVPNITLPIMPNTIYLIDLENKPMFNQILDADNGHIYIGFHNSMHHSISKYGDWHVCNSIDIDAEYLISKSNKFIYLIEGGVSDLVDHLMTMFMYPLAMYLNTHSTISNIYIVSGDKAGFCTKLCLEQALKWNGVNNIVIKNTISI